MSRIKRRKIRAHVMFATHEAKRRHGLRRPEPDQKKDEPPNSNAMVPHPLQRMNFADADPFDCLPVRCYPGMHDLLAYYFDNYPGPTPLAEDRLLRSQSAAVKRGNTQWDLISSHETSFLVLLAGISNQHFIISPHSRWRFDHLKMQNHTLRSIRESLASSRAKPSEIPESVIFAIAGLGCTVAVFNGDKDVALSHLNGARELIRLRGGMDTFQRFNRRAVIWCELHVCAAYQLRPTLAPAAPPWPTTTNDGTTTAPSPSPFPPALAALVSAAHARAASSYLPRHATTTTTTGRSEQLSHILSALTLVSTSTTSAWQAAAFRADGAAKEAVAAALDDAAHALLVEQARLLDNDDRGGGGDDGEGEEGEEEEGYRWAHAVMLHAANAYLWAALTELPAHLQLHEALVGRLRGALEGSGVGGGGFAAAGWTRRRGDGDCGDGAGGAGALGVEALMWALVVGWFVAERMGAKMKQLGLAGGGDEMVGWFEERILELLRAEGICEKERAARMVEDFPATDLFKRKWHCLLLQDKFCGCR
ncbi:hypothetical protein SLS58_006455 [Diplodia intermedia]|uniref:Uncharacterized protein n=1 Tax=Diplodia intermedia TaxID=856260 RepID=A0ABR3TN15_9PEZI